MACQCYLICCLNMCNANYTSVLTLVFLMTGTMDLNFVDIVGISKLIEGEPLKSVTSSSP